jgi:hypothetical protein
MMFDIIGRSLEAVRDTYLALEAEAAKVGLKINKQKTKYMIAAGNRTILDAEQFRSRQQICVLESSCDTEEPCGFGNTTKNLNCKLVLLRPAKTSAIISSSTSDKGNDLQELDPAGPVVRQ